MSNQEDRGIYPKFVISRLDGSDAPGGKHDKCRHYVLDIDHDKFAKPALIAYAKACKSEFPVLAKDIELLVGTDSTESRIQELEENLRNCQKTLKDCEKILADLGSTVNELEASLKVSYLRA
jgi:septal ring factor EnvC (AmiA/AmiB activator)